MKYLNSGETPMAKGRSRRRTALPVRMAELALAAPQVIALRSARMMSAGHQPTSADRAEFLRMHAEKAQAAVECTLSVAARLMRASQASMQTAMLQWWRFMWAAPWWLTLRVFTGTATGFRGLRLPQISNAAGTRLGSDLLAAGLKPVHRRATANARRLTRRRRRS
jgi:hypothetical protein